MKRKYVPVRMRNEVLERVKKEALARGMSVSETIGMLVEKSFESGTENRSERRWEDPGFDLETIKKMIEEATKNIHVSGPGIDQEAIKKIIAEAIDPIVGSLVNMRAEVRGIGTKSGQGSGSGISPETVKKMIEEAIKNAPLSGPGLSPEMNKQTMWETVSAAVNSAMKSQEPIRFLAANTARINAMLNGMSAKSDLSGHADRCKQADVWAQTEIKKLYGN